MASFTADSCMTQLSAMDRARISLAKLRQSIPFLKTGVDPLVLVFPHYRVAYIPIPKAANSSVKAALLPLIGLDPSGIDDIQAFRGFRKIPYSRFASMRTGDWYVFSVVRDPFSRYASAYLDKVVTREIVLRGFRRMGIRKGDSFQRFMSLQTEWPQKALNPHVIAQSTMLEDALRDGLNVFKLEDLPGHWTSIADEIRSRSGIEIGTLEQRNRGKSKIPWQSLYDAETIALARHLGAADFAMFQYEADRMGCPSTQAFPMTPDYRITANP